MRKSILAAWIAVSFAACKVYDPALLDRVRDGASDLGGDVPVDALEAGADTADVTSFDADAADATADIEAAPVDVCPLACEAGCVDPATDLHNCGACANDCLAPGVLHVVAAQVTCTAGACAIGATGCEPGWANCDGNASNGCETDITTASNCGACGTVCDEPTPLCTASGSPPSVTWACSSGCSGVTPDRCNMMCTDRRNDVGNCGTCGNSCAVPAGANHAVPACVRSACTIQCRTGYGDCNTDMSDGCEINTQTTPQHCGGCGMACPVVNHSNPTCTNGGCVARCDANFGDCDNNATNGCEVDLRSTAAHCGACGRACPAATNGSVACALGMCVVTCNTGYESEPVSGACVSITPPRLYAPMSFTSVTRRRPGFTAEAVAGTDGLEVQVCSNRTCASVIGTYTGTASLTAVTDMDLPLGVLYWRARARRGTAPATRWSDARPFRVRTVTAASNSGPDTSYGNYFDFDGDGLADVLVGAPTTGQFSGAAYLLFGQAGTQLVTGRTPAQPPVTVYGYGRAISSAGDVDGDGFGDALINAFGSTKAFVVFGNSGRRVVTGTTTATVRELAAPVSTTGFAASLTGLGDVNGDGLAEAAVGASAASGGSDAVFVYRGTAGATPSMPWRVTSLGSQFGLAIAAAGDVNGDRYADLVAGAPGIQTAYVLLGGTDGFDTASGDRIKSLSSSYARFGAVLAGGGDFNGDGYADVAFGAPDTNRVAVYYGSPVGIDDVTPVTLSAPSGLATTARFGASVTVLGDINGDGYADLGVGAPAAAKAYLYLGQATGFRMPITLSLTADAGVSDFGAAIRGLGDLNGDGFDDFGVAAPGSQKLYLYAGFATIATSGPQAPVEQVGVSTPYPDSFGFDFALRWEPGSRLLADPRRS